MCLVRALPCCTPQSCLLPACCRAGDADLYLRTDGQVPSNTFFQLSSTRSIGDDIITLRPGTRYYNASALLTIAVYGFTPNATFQLTYSSAQSVVQVADGVTMTGTVVHTSPTITYNYYSFASSRGTAYFQLTSLTGDSDMFVSVWSNQSPSFRPSVSQVRCPQAIIHQRRRRGSRKHPRGRPHALFLLATSPARSAAVPAAEHVVIDGVRVRLDQHPVDRPQCLPAGVPVHHRCHVCHRLQLPVLPDRDSQHAVSRAAERRPAAAGDHHAGHVALLHVQCAA